MILTLALLTIFSEVRAAEPASQQPYIDSLISELPKETYSGTAANPDPYIQSLRTKLKAGPNEDASGYTEELRKEIPSDGSEGYSERLGRTLPKDTGSAIEDYRKGKKLKPNKGSLETRSAFGFKLFATATRTYSASAENIDVAYETVYGSGWVPDFAVHYEWRPFTGSFIKKFGLYTSVGASFTKALGKLNYQGPFGTDSRTEFKFITIPVNIGLIYRMNFGDIIYPYFAGGPSMVGLIEQRNDKTDGNKGYTPGYWFSGGVALGLDWISPKNSWEQYESTGAKHTYLTLDYTRLESLGAGLVEFTVDGVEVGFTFEL